MSTSEVGHEGHVEARRATTIEGGEVDHALILTQDGGETISHRSGVIKVCARGQDDIYSELIALGTRHQSLRHFEHQQTT